MISIERDAAGFFHPRSEAEIVSLVKWAAERSQTIRVCGSAHSRREAIISDARRVGRRDDAVELVLDRHAAVKIDVATKQVTVQAGCRFARDPRDPSGRSSDANGLCQQLDAAGLALGNLGGVSHQTIAGFLATGSSGGSTQFDLGTVLSLRLVDGLGEVHELQRGDERLDAALVSMGLLGVVTQVTFQCVDRYDVAGSERISRVDTAEVDLFSTSLPDFLRRNEYARVLWWPQDGVKKLAIWTAQRTELGGRAPRRYEAMPAVFDSTLPAQAVAGGALQMLGSWRSWVKPTPVAGLLEAVRPQWVRPALLNAFVAETIEPQQFQDTWWRALPMDNDMDERLLPTSFTELWFPLDRAPDVMKRLRTHYERKGRTATGNFAVEIYAARGRDAWLSPSNGGDALRLNFFWFDRNGDDDPDETFYPQFWALLGDLDMRAHWGKALPSNPTRMLSTYPRHADFLKLREAFDPHGRFLTDYWRHNLGISEVRELTPAPESLRPPRRAFKGQLPLVYSLKPTDESFVARAKFKFENSAVIDAPAIEVHRVLATAHQGEQWVPLFLGMDRLSGVPTEEGSVCDEVFRFMTLRLRTVKSVLGAKHVVSIDGCTLPLASEMLEVVDLSTDATGKTRFRWCVYYDLLPSMTAMHPMLRPVFATFFKTATARLAAHLNGLTAASARRAAR